jgi:hypothetical protein
MTDVLPMRYMGEGMFKCLRPRQIRLEVGDVSGWQMAEHRSAESHRHYFSCIRNAWINLPDDLADRLPSPEHLRHHALVKTGFGKISEMAFKGNPEAIRAAAVMSEMDTYAVVNVSGPVVTIGRAESQSMKAMGKARFQESKEAVLNYISQLIGTDAATLGRQEQAA